MSSTESLINAGVPILILLLIGWALAYFHVWTSDARVPIRFLNLFVYYLAVPALVFQGLARKDFFELDWDFVAVFLLLRIFSALIILLAIMITSSSPLNITDVLSQLLSHWIGTTWFSTLIFGIPMLESLYGPAVQLLNVLAAISSLFFQMPTMLTLFEVRSFFSSDNKEDSPSVQPVLATADNTTTVWSWWRLAKHVLRNPPLIFILLGLFYSLTVTSNVNPCTRSFPVIFEKLCTSLGNTVTPVGAIVIGLFMHGPFWSSLKSNWPRVALYLITKLFLLPALCIPIVLMLDIDGIKARSAVYIASLPISIASFTLAHKFTLAKTEMACCVALGTLLMLPTFLIWQGIFDATGLFDDGASVFIPSSRTVCP